MSIDKLREQQLKCVSRMKSGDVLLFHGGRSATFVATEGSPNVVVLTAHNTYPDLPGWRCADDSRRLDRITYPLLTKFERGWWYRFDEIVKNVQKVVRAGG